MGQVSPLPNAVLFDKVRALRTLRLLQHVSLSDRLDVNTAESANLFLTTHGRQSGMQQIGGRLCSLAINAEREHRQNCKEAKFFHERYLNVM